MKKDGEKKKIENKTKMLKSTLKVHRMKDEVKYFTKDDLEGSGLVSFVIDFYQNYNSFFKFKFNFIEFVEEGIRKKKLI